MTTGCLWDRRGEGPGARAVMLWAAALFAGFVGCGEQVRTFGPLAEPVTPGWSALTASSMIPRGSTWLYLDDGSDQGIAWRGRTFDDGGWKIGVGQIGYGDGDETTLASFGPDPSNKYRTTYFRRSFTVTGASGYRTLTLHLLRDDGAVAYLNDVEVFRTNMPGGIIDARTMAPVATPDENTWFEASLNPALLHEGTNVLAIEVHQSWPTSSDISFDSELAGEWTATTPPPTPPPVGGASRVESYLANYGPWNAGALAVGKRHGLVIAHPRYGQLTRNLVADFQRGADPSDARDDVRVLCYVSIGEDLRSAYVTDAQARQDPRFAGDLTGPRIDPRGPNADGKSLGGIDPRGVASNGGTGYASFYLDDNSVDRGAAGIGDGIPDRNAYFGSYFVNAGDPKWFDVVDSMTLDGADGIAGFREILTTTYGRGLGCDGVFLDTLDTAAPNGYTSKDSFNQSEFEWTAPGLASFVRHVRAAYPGKLIMQNRGLFFLDPRHPQYQFTTRGAIDFLLFESYRLNSSGGEQWNTYFYPDNRFNVAPKVMAEASRADGFQVLSLGYAEGPPDGMSPDTLLGQSTLGFDSLIEDIRITEELAGFRHYLTNAKVTLVNSFRLDHARLTDNLPPLWTSTFNDHQPGWPNAPGEPTPRVGVQQVIPGAGSGQLTLRWDVAMDMNAVGYAAYLRTTPFDFAADPGLGTATRSELSPQVPPNYPGWGGPGIFANQATLTGLSPGGNYYVIVRAFDRSADHNEEGNRVVVSGVAAP